MRLADGVEVLKTVRREHEELPSRILGAALGRLSVVGGASSRAETGQWDASRASSTLPPLLMLLRTWAVADAIRAGRKASS